MRRRQCLRRLALDLFAPIRPHDVPLEHYAHIVVLGIMIALAVCLGAAPVAILSRLIHATKSPSKFQVYIWVTEKERCWEAQGLAKILADIFVSAE